MNKLLRKFYEIVGWIVIMWETKPFQLFTYIVIILATILIFTGVSVIV